MKNIKLLTKESFVQLKNKWALYLFFILFLILSIGVIIGLVSFTFSFKNNGSNYVVPQKLSSLNLYQGNFSYDNLKRDNNEKSYYNFLKSKGFKDNEMTQIINNNNQISKDVNPDIYVETEPFFHNIFKEWLANVAFKSPANHPKNGNEFWTNDNFPTYYNYLEYRTPSLPTRYQSKNILLYRFDMNKNNPGFSKVYPWLERDENIQQFILDKKISTFSFSNVKENEIIVTPTFLKANNLKLGSLINISYKNLDYLNLKIVATGTYAQWALTNVSNRVFLNPFIYTKIMQTYPDDFGADFNFLTLQTKEMSKKELNAFYISQYEAGKKTLLMSFNPNVVDNFIKMKTVQSSPIGSFEQQFTLYNIFTWLITVILLILLFVSYYFIQSLMIRTNKRLLINLKAIGVNAKEINYYLMISFVPLLTVGTLLGLLLGYFSYGWLGNTLGYSVGFVFAKSPSTIVGYMVLIGIFAVILILAIFLAYLSTRNNALSINNKEKISWFSMQMLSIKNWPIFKTKNSGFGKIVYSFQVMNLFKAFVLLIISLISFTLVGISLQFPSSINKSLDYHPEFFKDGANSLSYRESDQGKITNTNLVLNKDVHPFVHFVNKENQTIEENFRDWLNEITKQVANKKIYNFYFDQTYALTKLYSENALKINQIIKEYFPNKEIEDNVISNAIKKIIGQIDLYKQNFGNSIKNQPIILFKNRVITEGFVSYVESHDATMTKVNGENKISSGLQIWNDDSKSLKNNEMIIDYRTAQEKGLNVGDQITLKFNKTKNFNDTNQTFIIKKINNKLYTGGIGIVNFSALRSLNNQSDYVEKLQKVDDGISNLFNNGVIWKNQIPYDLKNIVLPIFANDGSNIKDYFPQNLSDVSYYTNYLSLPLARNYVEGKTKFFINFTQLITVFLVLISVCVLIVINILIVYENKKNILVLKAIGYDKWSILGIFASLYFVIILISFIASIFISGVLIDKFSPLILSKLWLSISHNYSATTIIPPLAIGIFFGFVIVWTMLNLYRKTDIKEITFSE